MYNFQKVNISNNTFLSNSLKFEDKYINQLCLLLGSTRDQEQQNGNYGSKARGGLARQEAVDGKGYLSRVSFL